MNKRRVVITGMGLVSCFGSDTDKFYAKLLAGESGVTAIDQFDCSDWPTRFAASIKELDVNIDDYMDKKQARRFDPFIRYAMIASKKALASAGLTNFDNLDKKLIGVLVSSGMGGMTVFHDGVITVHEKGYRRLTPFFVPYIITNMAPAMVAIDFGFMGPTYSISTACATANYSILQAARHIQAGEANIMLAGGTEAPMNTTGVGGFVACKALSERNDAPTKASRPWDKGRDGFVMGEGAGVIVLEELEHALKRGAPILAEFMGGATSTDAYHMTEPRPDGLGVRMCIEKAVQETGLPKERVNHINAHATSTPAGDLAEVRAITSFFGPHSKNISINSTKSMIGHCLGAAGGIEAIAVIKAIQTGKVHPTINLENPEEEIAALHVPTKAENLDVDIALSNSFGFGGHNSVIAFGPYRSKRT